MIDRDCPNCGDRITFSYLSLYLTPRGEWTGPTLPGTVCESCGEHIAMPTWWLFVVFCASVALAYLFYTHAGGSDRERNFFFAVITFAMFQSVVNALYVWLGGKLQILA